jgi:hypothetical protein
MDLKTVWSEKKTESKDYHHLYKSKIHIYKTQQAWTPTNKMMHIKDGLLMKVWNRRVWVNEKEKNKQTEAGNKRVFTLRSA